MQFSASAILALVASLTSVTAAPSALHTRVHARRSIQINEFFSILPSVSSADVQEGKIDSLPYQNKIVNNATVPATLVFWKSQGYSGFSVAATAINPAAPALQFTIEPNEEKWVSFSDKFVGAYAPVWPDTPVGVAANIPEAWIELDTTSDQWSSATVDVSYLPNTVSRWTAVEVDNCISDKSACSFGCRDGMKSCVNKEDVIMASCQNTNTNAPGFFRKANTNNKASGAWEGGCFISDSGNPTKKFITTLNSSQ